MFLSNKTRKKNTVAVKKFCPKCHKRFCRLNTHLRTSAMCREFPLLPESAADTQSEQHQAIPAGPERPTILNFTPPLCVEKSHLRLPESQEEWEEANTYFSQVLVPQVISQVSPDSKNSVLSEGVYTFFSSKYGTIQPSKKNRRQNNCAQALNRAKRLKN